MVCRFHCAFFSGRLGSHLACVSLVVFACGGGHRRNSRERARGSGGFDSHLVGRIKRITLHYTGGVWGSGTIGRAQDARTGGGVRRRPSALFTLRHDCLSSAWQQRGSACHSDVGMFRGDLKTFTPNPVLPSRAQFSFLPSFLVEEPAFVFTGVIGPFWLSPLGPSFFFCLKNGVRDRFPLRAAGERARILAKETGGTRSSGDAPLPPSNTHFVCLSCLSPVAAPSRCGCPVQYRPARYVLISARPLSHSASARPWSLLVVALEQAALLIQPRNRQLVLAVAEKTMKSCRLWRLARGARLSPVSAEQLSPLLTRRSTGGDSAR